LWHQEQASGQPLRKTVVRRPGPSFVEKRWILKTVPDGSAALPDLAMAVSPDAGNASMRTPVEANQCSQWT
jgi:hypothetical protein